MAGGGTAISIDLVPIVAGLSRALHTISAGRSQFAYNTGIFRMVTIMTTNAGAENISRRTIGFTQQDHSTDGLEAINRMFTPEFRNRLDSIVQFEPLDEAVILTVVDKFLTELQGQLDEKRVTIDVDEDARLWLVEKGYDRNMGARPMARIIQEHIKKPLAELVLFGELAQSGGTALVRLNKADDKLDVLVEEEEVELAES